MCVAYYACTYYNKNDMFKLKDTHSKQAFIAETSRVEAYSDAIIAIIMTLLVFNLKAPVLQGLSATEDLRIVNNIWPQFLAFIVSFIALAVIWVNHHHFFHALKGIDKKLLWHNNHILVWVCLVPFATALAGENFGNPTATAVYGLVMLMMSVAFSLTIRHAFFYSVLLPDTVNKNEREKQFRRSLIGPIAYVVGIFWSFFFPYISMIIYVLIMLFYFLPQRIEDAVSDAVGA